jgi:hypothetical protein
LRAIGWVTPAAQAVLCGSTWMLVLRVGRDGEVIRWPDAVGRGGAGWPH